MKKWLRNRLRSLLWPSKKWVGRKGLAVSLESWGEWIRRPEYAYLMDCIQDQAIEAEQALIGANANDPAQIARIQASIRLFRSFLDGQVRDGITEELKMREKRKEELNG